MHDVLGHFVQEFLAYFNSSLSHFDTINVFPTEICEVCRGQINEAFDLGWKGNVGSANHIRRFVLLKLQLNVCAAECTYFSDSQVWEKKTESKKKLTRCDSTTG